MTGQYQFSMTVTVHDETELFEAAINRAVEDGLDAQYARELLSDTYEGVLEIDCARCIQMLADPGTSWPGTDIEESSCE